MTIESERRVRNQTLRDVRMAMRMSQSEFAAAIRRAGDALGESNTCNKRLVQKWESGEHGVCRPNYRRALQAVTHLHYSRLGFTDAAVAPPVASMPNIPAAAAERCPTRVKWRAVALAEIARAAIGVHDFDRFVDFGTRAMDLTEHLEVSLARNPLRALGPALKIPPDTPVSRALLARINSMPT